MLKLVEAVIENGKNINHTFTKFKNKSKYKILLLVEYYNTQKIYTYMFIKFEH